MSPPPKKKIETRRNKRRLYISVPVIIMVSMTITIPEHNNARQTEFGACKDRVFCIASYPPDAASLHFIREHILYYIVCKHLLNKLNATPHTAQTAGVRRFPSFSGSISNQMMTLECCTPVPDHIVTVDVSYSADAFGNCRFN